MSSKWVQGRQGSGMSSDDVPEELEEQCTKCHVALAGIEQLLQSVMAVSRTQMEEKVNFQLMPILSIQTCPFAAGEPWCCFWNSTADILYELFILEWVLLNFHNGLTVIIINFYLLSVYLTTHGVDPKSHPIKRELVSTFEFVEVLPPLSCQFKCM